MRNRAQFLERKIAFPALHAAHVAAVDVRVISEVDSQFSDHGPPNATCNAHARAGARAHATVCARGCLLRLSVATALSRTARRTIRLVHCHVRIPIGSSVSS